jgi:hypothetical protein
MDDVLESRAGAVALMGLGMLAALACASAIGAATALVVIAMDTPASAAPGRLTRTPQSDECAVVAWKSGTSYCFRNKSAEVNGPMRNGPAVVVQAQADPAR